MNGSAQPSSSQRPKPRTARIFGREYRVILPSVRDPRLHVAMVLLTLQALGQTVLGFRLSIAQILVCLATGALIEFGVAFFKDKQLLEDMYTRGQVPWEVWKPRLNHGKAAS